MEPAGQDGARHRRHARPRAGHRGGVGRVGRVRVHVREVAGEPAIQLGVVASGGADSGRLRVRFVGARRSRGALPPCACPLRRCARHPGEQCGHERQEAHGGVHGRGFRVRHGHQFGVGVPLQSAGAPSPPKSFLGGHPGVHFLRRRCHRHRQRDSLRRDQRSDKPDHQEFRMRMGQGRHPCQQRGAVVHQHGPCAADVGQRRLPSASGEPHSLAACGRAPRGGRLGGLPLHAHRRFHHRPDHQHRWRHDCQWLLSTTLDYTSLLLLLPLLLLLSPHPPFSRLPRQSVTIVVASMWS